MSIMIAAFCMGMGIMFDGSILGFVFYGAGALFLASSAMGVRSEVLAAMSPPCAPHRNRTPISARYQSSGMQSEEVQPVAAPVIAQAPAKKRIQRTVQQPRPATLPQPIVGIAVDDWPTRQPVKVGRSG